DVVMSSAKSIVEREICVYIVTSVATASALTFRASESFIDIKIGEKARALYEVTNTSDAPIRALASYNVEPKKVGLYFKKIECYCFKEQTYKPGETVKLPVVFFVDPDMAKDWQADDVRGITLSYTYFRATGPQASARLEDASAVN